MQATKIVGSRKPPSTPAERYARGAGLQREANLLCPFPKPRGFIYKAPRWEDWNRWRAAQENPRLW